MLRNKVTGDSGELVHKDGKMHVRVARPNRTDFIAYREDEWREEDTRRPMSPVQMAQVAFEADKKLCYFLGLHREARRDWVDLDEEERIDIVKHGIDASQERRDLWAMVCETLREM